MAFETHLHHPQRGGQIPSLSTLKQHLHARFTQLRVK